MKTPEKKRNLILGVDPGFTGALALYDPVTQLPVEIHDMPLMKFKESDKKKVLDLPALSMLIDSLSPRILLAMIEGVGAMPEQGVVSMFRFGMVTGQVHGILSANYIPIFFTKPAVWKSAMNVPRDKSLAMSHVKAKYPNHVHLFGYAKDHGRAEALLIAEFAARFLKN